MTRACLRGCTTPEGDPREAAAGSYLCDRCARRLRHHLVEAPDLCVRIRATIDPMKAQVYDREKLGGPMSSESRPPMSLDAIEAADEVYAILTYFAEVFGDDMVYRTHTFAAGVDGPDVYHLAKLPAGYLLEQLPGIVNDHRVDGFARAVLGPAVDEDSWTIAMALRRWPDHMPDRWAKQPCPRCEQRTVRVRAPRMLGDTTVFWCANEACAWEPPADEVALWSEYFGIRSHEHSWTHLPEWPAGEVRCGCGSRAVETGEGLRMIEEAVA